LGYKKVYFKVYFRVYFKVYSGLRFEMPLISQSPKSPNILSTSQILVKTNFSDNVFDKW